MLVRNYLAAKAFATCLAASPAYSAVQVALNPTTAQPAVGAARAISPPRIGTAGAPGP